MSELITLYGGTFDPVHYGHLKPIEILAQLIGLHLVIIIPNNIPHYRPQPRASIFQRKTMLELATANKPLFSIAECDLYRKISSYTSKILQEWRAKCGLQQPIAFIVGQDSLINLHLWYQYEMILDKSHLIVCRRPGYPLLMKEEYHQQWLEYHLTDNINDIRTRPAGNIYLAETPWFDISSSTIRNRLKHGESCEELIPLPVMNYIFKHGIY